MKVFSTYNKYGYTVWKGETGNYEEVYRAYNSKFDSQQGVDPESPNAVGIFDLKKWANEEGESTALELGLEFVGVQYDKDEELEIDALIKEAL